MKQLYLIVTHFIKLKLLRLFDGKIGDHSEFVELDSNLSYDNNSWVGNNV